MNSSGLYVLGLLVVTLAIAIASDAGAFEETKKAEVTAEEKGEEVTLATELEVKIKGVVRTILVGICVALFVAIAASATLRAIAQRNQIQAKTDFRM